MNAPSAPAATTTDAAPPGGYVPPERLLRVAEESAATARREVTRALARWGLPQLAPDAEVVVSELVANAVAHVRTLGPVRDRRIGLTVRRVPEGVLVEVHDAGSQPPPRPAPEDFPDLAEGGRGLLIVGALTEGVWGTSPRPHGAGKVVWALLTP
jgi:anti-sigma regulatory factor (Ser/Thr protein kinase)